MGITVRDITGLFVEESFQKIKIFDSEVDGGEDVYEGTIDDCPSELLDREVQGIDTLYDPTDTITFNV